MSKHKKESTIRYRSQVQTKNEGVFKGKVWVKKAGMFCEYTCFNTPNKTDIFIFS